MATSRQQSATSRRKAPAASRPASAAGSRSRSTSRTNGRSTASQSRARSASSGGARKPSAARTQSPQRAATGGGGPGSVVAKVAKPALAGGAAIAAIVGGAVLGAKAIPRKRKFPASLGNPLNGLGKSLDMKKARKQIESVDMKKARKQIGRGAKQFGELTRELRKAGEQAERIGDALL